MVKRLTFVAIVLALSLFSVSAQAERSGKNSLSLLVYGGFSLANHQGENQNISGRTGLSYGVGFDVKLLPAVSLGIDALMIHKGYDEVQSDNTKANYLLTFLSFPVTLKWWPAPWLMFQAGPYLASFNISSYRITDDDSQSVKSEFRNDYGVTLGMWSGFNVSAVTTVGLNIRYDMGLADIHNNNSPSRAINTRAVLIMGNMIFTLK